MREGLGGGCGSGVLWGGRTGEWKRGLVVGGTEIENGLIMLCLRGLIVRMVG